MSEFARFLAVDVETANASRESVCQVGVTIFEAGREIGTWERFINPEAPFDAFNLRLLGRQSDWFLQHPPFSDIALELADLLSGEVLVSHSWFDKTSLTRAFDRYGVPFPDYMRWYDSVAMARRAWPDRWTHRLSVLAKDLGFELRHHDAVSDARVCGQIALAALNIDPNCHVPVAIDRSIARYNDGFNLEGPFAGSRMCFTNAMQTLSRLEAANLAAGMGFQVVTSVSKKLDYLCLGTRPADRWAQDKSAKHIKAEALQAEGAALQIITEADFVALVSAYGLTAE